MPPRKNGGLQVINASFNKTGTKSIHEALKVLGHTVEDCQESVYRHYPEWERLWNGEDAGKIYREIFGPNNPHGYTACCDTPGNVLWESLADEFPEAKVILVIRDENKWMDSFDKFFKAEQRDFLEMRWHRLYGHLYRFIFPHTARPMRVYMDFLRPLVLGPEVDKFYGTNRTVCLKQYREHNNYVLNKCPKERLLVYRIGDGWEPLCKFLGEPIPKVDFPWSNRAASVIYELTHHPDYIATWRRQFICFGIRLAMIAIGAYLYKTNFEILGDVFSDQWKKIAAIMFSVVLFYKA